jgi:hypothetical protein
MAAAQGVIHPYPVIDRPKRPDHFHRGWRREQVDMKPRFRARVFGMIAFFVSGCASAQPETTLSPQRTADLRRNPASGARAVVPASTAYAPHPI